MFYSKSYYVLPISKKKINLQYKIIYLPIILKEFLKSLLYCSYIWGWLFLASAKNQTKAALIFVSSLSYIYDTKTTRREADSVLASSRNIKKIIIRK